MNSLYKWLVFNSVTTFVAAYLIYYHNAINWLITNDTTHLSFVLAGIYVYVSGYFGYSIFKGTVNPRLYNWVARMLLVMGLIGTLLGMREVFASVSFSDLRSALTQLAAGIGIAQTTTLLAIVFGGLLELQYVFVTKDFGDER
jgi:hypothetical protein